MQRSFDLIVAGGGMAGLSLLWYLKQDGYTGSVCLIDSFDDQRLNRTWSYWSRETGAFDHLSSMVWNKARVVSGSGEELVIDLAPFRYLSIAGADFHHWVNSELQQWQNLSKLKAKVISCSAKNEITEVLTDQGVFEAPLVFDSTYRPNFDQPFRRNLLQHFLGYVIETDRDVFDPSCPDLMNFHVREKRDCHFIYILPQTARRALVEYTIFSESLLEEKAYDLRLREWLKEQGIHSFQIKEVEKGVIPMSDTEIPVKVNKGLYRIGTSGGFTNPATGYTFYITQKLLKSWSKTIVEGKEIPVQSGIWKGKFNWYYGTLLEVLKHRMQPAHEVFFRLYQKNPPYRILAFLNGESDFKSEWSIMSSTRIGVFMWAGIRVFFDMIRRFIRPK